MIKVGQMVTINGEVYEVAHIKLEGDRLIVTLVPFLLWEPTITITLEDNQMDKSQIQSLLNENGISIKALFVPLSQSRNRDEENPSLNWVVTLLHNDREVIVNDYSAGCGHCPSYGRGKKTVDMKEAIDYECENGYVSKRFRNLTATYRGDPILPDVVDVMYSLLMDSEAIDYPTYEYWADSLGYDEDSRKGESIYRKCLETGLKMRAAFGERLLAELREAFQDY